MPPVPLHHASRGPPPRAELGEERRATAYAKLNLALHVRRQRTDGYHELETLFAFVDRGDALTIEAAECDDLEILGEFAPHLGKVSSPIRSSRAKSRDYFERREKPGAESLADARHSRSTSLGMSGEGVTGGQADSGDNAVLATLAALPRPEGWRVTLDKRLPVAAGLGGGSADAGAVFRLVRDRFGLPDDWQARAAGLGADVPACVESRTCIGRGVGDRLAPGPQDLAGTPVLLVNPRLPLATGPVFAAWDGIDRGPLPEGTARAIALAGRNDLEAPALALCPAIGEVLAALRDTGAWLVRMSGSGATCFALFDDAARRDGAAVRLAATRPEWWRLAGSLR